MILLCIIVYYIISYSILSPPRPPKRVEGRGEGIERVRAAKLYIYIYIYIYSYYMYVYIYILCIHNYKHVYTYIYIYRERERDVHIIIYIYIYMLCYIISYYGMFIIEPRNLQTRGWVGRGPSPHNVMASYSCMTWYSTLWADMFQLSADVRPICCIW